MGKARGKSETAWSRMLAGFALEGAAMPVEARNGQMVQSPSTGTSSGRWLLDGMAAARVRSARTRAPQAPQTIAEIALASTGSDGAVLELAAFGWRELGGPGAGGLLDALVMLPGDAPIYTARIAREAWLEARASRDTVTLVAPGHAMWYIELEDARGDMPSALAMWRPAPVPDSPDVQRIAGIWTHGRNASAQHPVVVTVSWRFDAEGRESARAHALSGIEIADSGEQPDGEADAIALERAGALERDWAPKIMARAIARIVDSGQERQARRCAFDRAGAAAQVWREGTRPGMRAARRAAKVLHNRPYGPMEAIALHLEKLTAPPKATALDALVDAAERAYAASAWGMDHEAVKRPAWIERCGAGAMLWLTRWDHDHGGASKTGAPTAIDRSAQLIWSALGALGARTPEREHGTGPGLRAMRAPKTLWRALEDAGPAPAPSAPIAGDTLWYVEIEDPHKHEPRAIALWSPDERDTDASACEGIALWTADEYASEDTPLAIGWNAQGECTGARLAVDPALDIDDTELAALTRRCRALLHEGPWPIAARAGAAIAEHCDRLAEAAWRTLPSGAPPPPDTRAKMARNTSTLERPAHPSQSLFLVTRTPARTAPSGRSSGQAPGTAHALTERQRVGPHWRRQRHGPKGSLRKAIIIAEYERGPEPDDDHIALEHSS